MTKQKLSQLIDGELAPDEVEGVIDQILADPELQASWTNMHLLRAAVQHDSVMQFHNMMEDISLKLDDEPAITVSENLLVEEPVEDSGISEKIARAPNVVAFQSKRRKAFAYTAIAASFAALLMVTYSPNETPTSTIAESTVAEPMPMAVEQELQSMIVQHGEFSGPAALNGLVAYAKVVNGSSGSRSSR